MGEAASQGPETDSIAANFWGRFAFLVHLAGLAGAWALPASRSRLADHERDEQIYGVGLARDGVPPRWAPWCLVAGGALAPPVALLGITYVPHGVLITMLSGIALALVGFVTRRRVISPG